MITLIEELGSLGEIISVKKWREEKEKHTSAERKKTKGPTTRLMSQGARLRNEKDPPFC